MDKYYLLTETGFNSKRQEILRHNLNFIICIDEHVERPYINIFIDKSGNSKLNRPKSTEYSTYKETLKSIYEDYLNQVLKIIKNTKWENAEFYHLPRSHGWTDLVMYNTDEKNKIYIHINITDLLDGLTIDILRSTKYNKRPLHRKEGKPISEKIFVSALNETIKFLCDENSYLINYEEYGSKIRKIIAGEVVVKSSSEAVSTKELIDQLELKKEDIVKRLIENDSDTELQRASLRGEKEGIEYSLRAINNFFRFKE